MAGFFTPLGCCVPGCFLPPGTGQDPRPQGLRVHSEKSASKNRDCRFKSSFSVVGMASGVHLGIILDTFLLNPRSVFMTRVLNRICADIALRASKNVEFAACQMRCKHRQAWTDSIFQPFHEKLVQELFRRAQSRFFDSFRNVISLNFEAQGTHLQPLIYT